MGKVLIGLPIGTILGGGLGAALFVGCVGLFVAAAGVIGNALAVVPWTDPVYTRAALYSLADIHISEVSIVGVPHVDLFKVGLEPGSSVLGRLLAAGFAHAGVLAAGLLLLRKGIHRRRWMLISMSVATQLQVALRLVRSPPSLGDLETIGLSFALNMSLPWLSDRHLVVTDLVGRLPPPIVEAGLVSIAFVSAYVVAGLAVLSAITIGRRIHARRTSRGRSPSGAVRAPVLRASLATSITLLALSAIAAACQVAPIPPAATSAADPLAQIAPAATSAADPLAQSWAPALTRPAPSVTLPAPQANQAPLPPSLMVVGDRWFAEAIPSRVEIVQSDGGFVYLVNGTPQVIKGMGINTQYHSELSPSDRRARLDADLTEMHEMGVNTLVGWDPAEFDSILLDAAQGLGIGVVLPFELSPDTDYTDPSIRADLTTRVLAWVNQYRDYPALRMWGLGNEILHKIVHPAWVGPQDPHQAAEARAFSDWLVETADAIHAADPNHPVTYRDAEDAFVGWISRALERHPAESRPWFIYGTNCYQNYLSSIVDNWPDQGTGLALWVSEFAPGGLAIPDRPPAFSEMWGYIRRHPDWVLGGSVYAWTRNGPEEIDRNLGLTDDGKPVDGHSLDAIASFFQADDA